MYKVGIKNGIKGVDAKIDKAIKKAEFMASASLSIPEIDLKTDVGSMPIGDMQNYTLAEVQKALSMATDDVKRALNSAVSSSSWNWAGGSRDIIDTGKLKNSVEVAFSGGAFVISYKVPYAALIHYGGYIHPYGNKNAQKVYIPGRPWIDATVMGGGPVPQIQWDRLIEKYM